MVEALVCKALNVDVLLPFVEVSASEQRGDDLKVPLKAKARIWP